ncbi:MAG TPA: hypothetical protein VE646_11265, partial [Actinomycetota bacterium]|nr:hypothetical protein [Actinomycetota bacterium]
MPRRVLIMGAAGRDFHNFNAVYRDDEGSEVVAFTATQIPFISDRRYPSELAGPRYPEGIPIRDESELSSLIRDLGVQDVVFAYSDVSHEYVMHKGSEALAAGANFLLLGPRQTMLTAQVPVVAVCAVRTGSGKSQTTRAVAQVLRDAGKRVVAVRHPMPYGDLNAQRVQRFGTLEDGEQVRGKRVLVVEDGPTLTHGEMKFGAGVVAARRNGAAEIVDPRPYAVGTIEETYRKYDVGPVLPAMGYSDQQLREMEKMIDAAPVDLVLIASPIDLRHVIN